MIVNIKKLRIKKKISVKKNSNNVFHKKLISLSTT